MVREGYKRGGLLCPFPLPPFGLFPKKKKNTVIVVAILKPFQAIFKTPKIRILFENRCQLLSLIFWGLESNYLMRDKNKYGPEIFEHAYNL